MDVSSLARAGVSSQTSLLRQDLGIVAIRQANQASQAVANVVAKAVGSGGSAGAGSGRGQIIDITV